MQLQRTPEWAKLEAESNLWLGRAKELLDELVPYLEDSPADDAVSTAELVAACLRVAWGEPVPADLIEFFEDKEAAPPPCTCPPDLIARGGWKGDCPARGSAHG